MSTDIEDEFGIAEVNEDEEVALYPGACFGWYSHVSPDCHASCCLRSEWCRTYTLTRANQASNSMKKDLDEIGRDSNIKIVERKTSKDAMADLGRQAFFDKVVNHIASKIDHDNIKYSPKRDVTSIKIGGHVIIFLAKKRGHVFVQIGGRGKDGEAIKIKMGENIEAMESQTSEFLNEFLKQ